jgi:hypothetical protein
MRTEIGGGVEMMSDIEMEYAKTLKQVSQLERELVEAREELNDKRKFAYAVEQALDGVKGDYVEIIKELRKDAERYRYVRSVWGLPDENFNALIDAAMKEGK